MKFIHKLVHFIHINTFVCLLNMFSMHNNHVHKTYGLKNQQTLHDFHYQIIEC
jgi:hypothetical protein